MNAFKTLPFLGQAAVTVVLMAIILFVGYKFMPNVELKRKQIAEKESNLQELNQKVVEGLNLEKNLAGLQREIQGLEAQLGELKQIIPPLRYDSELIQRFESLAKRSRLIINSITPQRLRQKEFYDEYPIAIDVLATYHDLAKFFDRMSKERRVFNVQGVNIRQQLKGGSTSVAAKFTAVTFIYREDAPMSAAPGKSKGKKKKKKAGSGSAKDARLDFARLSEAA